MSKKVKVANDEVIVSKEFVKVSERSTICILNAESGIEVIGTSTAAEVGAFSDEIGNEIALNAAIKKLNYISGLRRERELRRDIDNGK